MSAAYNGGSSLKLSGRLVAVTNHFPAIARCAVAKPAQVQVANNMSVVLGYFELP